MEAAHIALVFSGIALTISLISLWANSLAPFSLRVTHDTPTFSLYKITPDVSGSKSGKTWWIPSFDIGFSFLNTGRRPGEILDIRLVADFTGHRSTRKYAFYPTRIVDYSVFQRNHTERFQWLEVAVLRDWYSLCLGGQKEAHLHLILEGERWDEKFEGNMSCKLQVISSQKKKWVDLGEYEWLIMNDMFEEKSSYTAFDKKREQLRKLCGITATEDSPHDARAAGPFWD